MFAYCCNNPILFTDSTGTSARIFLTDNPDLLSMPWEGAGSGGGRNTAAYRYLVVLSFKHSKNDCLSTLYKEVEELLPVDEWSEIKSSTKDVLENEIVEDPVGYNKVQAGTKKIQNGLDLILSPMPTYFDEAAGAVLIYWGMYSVVTGVGDLFDWEEDYP